MMRLLFSIFVVKLRQTKVKLIMAHLSTQIIPLLQFLIQTLMKEKRICSYRVTSQLLGEGAFSSVYLGYDSKNQKIAVKVIPRNKIQDQQMEIFQSQIKLLNRCKNQHIINFLDVKKSKSNFYIFLEYCEGGNLAEYITQRKTIDEKEALRLFSQIIKGMNVMKKMNVIHRDLKPVNIMLKDNNIKIVDFGLAKRYSKGQFLKTFAGTPFNMAPEILKGELYNEKADVYSAGTVLYEMLFGVCPYVGNNIQELLRNIQSKKMKGKQRLTVSKQVIQLLKKMLEPEPFLRYDFTDVMIDLQKIELKGRQIKVQQLKEMSLKARPYIGMIGGFCCFFNFDFMNVQQKSIYDLDLKLCGRLSQTLISKEVEWLRNIDLVRV